MKEEECALKGGKEERKSIAKNRKRHWTGSKDKIMKKENEGKRMCF